MEREVEKINRSKGDGDCKKCNGKGFIAVLENGEIKTYNCECESERRQKERIKKSGLEHQFKKQRLDNYVVDEKWQEMVKGSVERYINADDGAWMLLSGQVGSGKTHLIVAVANEFMLKNKNVRYMSWVYEMVMLQRDLSNFDVEISRKARAMFEELKSVDVLIIDDFMKTKSLDYVFELINHRYINDLQTLITSEHDYQKLMSMDEAIASRIYEKASKYYINITKDDKKNYRLG